MASLVIQNRIGLRFNNHTTAPLPKKFAANQLTRTGNRIASKKVGRNLHADQIVKQLTARFNFSLLASPQKKFPNANDPKLYQKRLVEAFGVMEPLVMPPEHR